MIEDDDHQERTQDDGLAPKPAAGVEDEPPTPYRVGPGKPPLHTRFKKGERSRNSGGRPRKLRPSLSNHQRHQDLAKALSQPIRLNGKLVPFNVLNIELMKQAAMKGDGLAQRYLDKLDQQNRAAIALEHADIARRIATYARRLAEGDPPGLVVTALNIEAERLEQLYLDPHHDPLRRSRREGARRVKAHERTLKRREAQLKAQGAWPPPGVVDDVQPETHGFGPPPSRDEEDDG